MKQIKLIPNFEARSYQQSIFAKSMNRNTLVVLPTGLGKTIVAIQLFWTDSIQLMALGSRCIARLPPENPKKVWQKTYLQK